VIVIDLCPDISRDSARDLAAFSGGWPTPDQPRDNSKKQAFGVPPLVRAALRCGAPAAVSRDRVPNGSPFSTMAVIVFRLGRYTT
jgi:hypothetical protein